jgi:hypothetical protein
MFGKNTACPFSKRIAAANNSSRISLSTLPILQIELKIIVGFEDKKSIGCEFHGKEPWAIFGEAVQP